MKTLIAASLSALVLAACASAPTPQEARGAYTEGYTERALSSNRYLIEYRMDGSDYQRAYDLALWRAAQLSLEKGYPAFDVVSRNSDTDVGARASTSFTTQHGVAYQRSCGLVSCKTYATPTTSNQITLGNDGRRPTRVVSLEVMLSRGDVGASPNRYDAAAIVSSSTNR